MTVVYQIRYLRRVGGEWSVWHNLDETPPAGMPMSQYVIERAREYPASGLGVSAEVRTLLLFRTYSTANEQPDLFSEVAP